MCIHAVIDNLSRKVLAWKVAERLEPATTRSMLLEALRGYKKTRQRLVFVITDRQVMAVKKEAGDDRLLR